MKDAGPELGLYQVVVLFLIVFGGEHFRYVVQQPHKAAGCIFPYWLHLGQVACNSRLSTLARIAKALGVTTKELYDEQPDA